MTHKFQFFLWLADMLEAKPMTLAEIQSKWRDSPMNDEGRELTSRTFERYRNEMQQLMNLDIVCDKRNGNVYSLSWDKYGNRELTNWLLSAFRISTLARKVEYHDKIVIDAAPQNSSYLDSIIEAIDKKCGLQFHYETPFGKSSDMSVVPAFVKLFCQRWYLICEIIGTKRPMICAFNRMTNLQIIENKHRLSKQMERLLRPDTFLKNNYGIIYNDSKPVRIRFRAFWPQEKYLAETPLHPSQTIVHEADGHMDFEIFAAPTYDLIQQLLWNRDKIAVLKPDFLKLEIIDLLKNMQKSYETGENYSGD